MNVWEVTESGCSCGSGWGTPYLFVCFNDDCPPFVEGWAHMKQTYGKRCSYRCIAFPDSNVKESMLVYSIQDGKAGIVDETVIASDKLRGTDADPEVQALIRCFEADNVTGLLDCVLDRSAYYKTRQKAVDLVGELGRQEVIEPLRNHRFIDERVQERVGRAVDRILRKHAVRECPFCLEIIAADCAFCSECGRALGEDSGL
jgi:hypothetical protein